METNFANIKDRILQIPNFKGVSKEKFFQELGVTYGNFKGKAKNKALSSDTLATLVTMFPDISSDWILTGQGSMIKSTSIKSESDFDVKLDIKRIPLVSTEAVAGFGSDSFSINQSDIIQTYIIPDFNDIQFMLRVKGNSMNPSFQSGDIVACRVVNNPSFIQWGKVHLVATKSQGLIIKRLKPSASPDHYRCISDNPEFDAFEIPLHEITGIALIVGFVRIE